MYKFLFCGLGSIGKRHLSNVAKYCVSRGIDYVIDAVRSGSGALDEDVAAIIRKSFSYEDAICEQYDVAFITNPTHKHFATIKQYASAARNMFIEKPVFDSTELKVSDLCLDESGIYYVACPLRYNKVLQYIKENVDCSKAISVRSICSSYLPDWRPNVDYREVYSAHKDMGGGVEIDLVHEWDYLIWLFGFPTKVAMLSGTLSDLEIDSSDLAVYIAKKDKLSYELHLDYFGRKSLRELQIFLPDETIIADVIGGNIKYLKSEKTISLVEERNDYQMKEIGHFFDILNGVTINDNTIDNALKVLRISLGRS